MENSTYVVSYSIRPGGRLFEYGLRELFREVALKAIDKAGVAIDAVYIANAFSGVLQEQLALASYLTHDVGLKGVHAVRVECGDGSSGLAVAEAYKAVRSGLYECVLIVGVEKLHDANTLKINKALAMITDYEFEGFFGVTIAAQAALALKEYLLKNEMSYEEFANWVVKMSERGSRNPYAYMRKKVTIKDILESEVVADPLRLHDTAPPIDGAAAVILCSKPIKSDFKIEIVGLGSSSLYAHINERDDLTILYTTRNAVEKALKMSGLSIEDIGFVETHDLYSIFGVLAVESMGLVRRGHAIRAIMNGELDEKPVVNASGGLKSLGFAGGASGLYQFVMGIMELLGERPFESYKHDIALIHDMTGFDVASTAFVIKRAS